MYVCELVQEWKRRRRGQIPAFGEWDLGNQQLPITQYFECATALHYHPHLPLPPLKKVPSISYCVLCVRACGYLFWRVGVLCYVFMINDVIYVRTYVCAYNTNDIWAGMHAGAGDEEEEEVECECECEEGEGGEGGG